MSAEVPEKRDPARANERTSLRPEDMAVLVCERRYNGERPENLDGENFSSYELEVAVRDLFARLEGKLNPERVEQLRAGFERSVAVWEQAGLFTGEREQRGYRKPNFEEDYLPLITPEILAMMEEGEGLNSGYDSPIWIPQDVPLHSVDPEKPSYFKVLEGALRTAYNGTAGGKAPQTLLIGPERRVIDASQVNLEEMLWRWERYLKEEVVCNPRTLDPINHGGMTEAQVLEGLQGVERQTGGVMRLERTRLVMPRDVGRSEMSAQDWGALLGGQENPLPREASSGQDIKEAMAFVIYCLETQGWIPDFYDWNNVRNSRVALALGTYIPDEGAAGAVAALNWFVRCCQFGVVGRYADNQFSYGGVRPGVRMG